MFNVTIQDLDVIRVFIVDVFTEILIEVELSVFVVVLRMRVSMILSWLLGLRPLGLVSEALQLRSLISTG